MASLLRTASIGNLQRHIAATPVLIGSPHFSRVDRHSKRAAGHRAFSAGECFHSSAAESLAVGRLSVAPSGINASVICRGAAPHGAVISQRSGRCLFATVFRAVRQLPANPPVKWDAVKAASLRACRPARRPLLSR